jgi:hypothetical protein
MKVRYNGINPSKKLVDKYFLIYRKKSQSLLGAFISLIYQLVKSNQHKLFFTI